MRLLEQHAEEISESWQEQKRKINSLGTIKEIVNSQELLLEILTYSGDRHLIGQFYDMLNEAINNHEVLPEDLHYLRNGWLGNCIINLSEVVEKSGRKIYPFEMGDKLNYSTQINDIETQIATFTNPKVIETFAEINPNREIKYVEQSLSYLSVDARLRIIEEIIKVGNITKAISMLNELNKELAYLRECRDNEIERDNMRRA